MTFVLKRLESRSVFSLLFLLLSGLNLGVIDELHRMYAAMVDMKERTENQLRSELLDLSRQSHSAEISYQQQLSRLTEVNEDLEGFASNLLDVSPLNLSMHSQLAVFRQELQDSASAAIQQSRDFQASAQVSVNPLTSLRQAVSPLPPSSGEYLPSSSSKFESL